MVPIYRDPKSDSPAVTAMSHRRQNDCDGKDSLPRRVGAAATEQKKALPAGRGWRRAPLQLRQLILRALNFPFGFGEGFNALGGVFEFLIPLAA